MAMLHSYHAAGVSLLSSPFDIYHLPHLVGDRDPAESCDPGFGSCSVFGVNSWR